MNDTLKLDEYEGWYWERYIMSVVGVPVRHVSRGYATRQEAQQAHAEKRVAFAPERIEEKARSEAAPRGYEEGTL